MSSDVDLRVCLSFLKAILAKKIKIAPNNITNPAG